MNRWPLRLRRLAVGTVVFICVLAADTVPSDDAPEKSAPPPAGQEVRSWVQVITGNNELPTRLLGAKQLLKLQSPEAEAAVIQILTSNQTDAVVAVTQALADLNGNAPQSLIEPLVQLLRSQESSVRESAINALASFRNKQVALRVGRVAANRTLDIQARLAAIEVLRRTAGEAQAVEAMVPLVSDPDARIRGPVFAILELISQQQFNNDADAVRAWWEDNRDKPAGERWRRILQESDASLRRARADLRTAHTRLVAALTELYDRSGDADRPTRLLSYLQDPIADVRSLGATLVKSMIADRKAVSDQIVAGLSALIDDPNVQVRRDALSAIRDLRRGELAGRLMARWSNEPNADVRADLVGALGRLGNPEAVPFLTDLVTNESNNFLAAAAAESLGRLRGSGAETDAIMAAAEPLLSLFERIPPVEVESRARVLGAMSAIADPRFLPTFVALLDDDEPSLRLAAVRGVAAIGGAAQIAQLVPRMEDPDASVRSVAVDAVAQGGRDAAQLEALFARTSPAVEPVETIRDNAWRGCLRILRSRGIPAQLEWASRIDPAADLSSARRLAELLTPLVAPPIAQQISPDQLAKTEWKLGIALRQLQRYDDAAIQLRAALDQLGGADQPDARLIAAELVGTLLDADRTGDAVDMIRALFARWPDADLVDLGDTLVSHLEAKLEAGEADLVLEATEPLMDDSTAPACVAMRLQIEDVRDEASAQQQTQSRETVRAALDEIQDIADPDDPAVRKILALGNRAERPLIEIMRETIVRGGTDGDGVSEARALELLKRLRPDWPGYAPDATAEEKNAALNAVEATGAVSVAPTP